MTAELVVHCGAYKTGSSRIQNHLHASRERLLAQGVLYPETGLVTEEAEVGLRHSRLAWSRPGSAEWTTMVEALAAEVRAAGPARVLLSSEVWSRPSNAERLGVLVADLRRAGVVGPARGVLYLRSPIPYARSLYREFTRRRGNCLAFADYCAQSRRALDPVLVVEALRAVLGDGLDVVRYREGHDVAADLAARLDLPAPGAAAAVNRGLGAVEVELARHAHRHGVPVPTLEQALATLPARALPEDWARAVETAPAAHLADLAERAGALAAVTGWTPAEVEDLLTPPDADGPPVEDLARVLEACVLAWDDAATAGARGFAPAVDLRPSRVLEHLEVRTLVGPWERLRLGGVALPAVRLLALTDRGEVEVPTGLPSPGFARRHPGVAGGGAARFGHDRLECGLRRSLELLADLPDGRRVLVARVG